MSSPIVVNAPAKINLFLNLLGSRPDGFHEVRFVMQELELSDTLTVTPEGPGNGIEFGCSLPTLSTPDNLVVRAYQRFYQVTGLPSYRMQVILEKNIPVQAGLGGGSSDAAAMLKVLNGLHYNIVPMGRLCTIAAELGSDVPFFLYGGTCIATGRGEVITPQPRLPSRPIVLLSPRHYGVSTAEAYGEVRRVNQYQEVSFEAWDAAFKSDNLDQWSWERYLHNDFERAIFPLRPDLSAIKEWLGQMDMPGVLMSGSGPTLFGVLTDPEYQMPHLLKEVPEEEWLIMETRTV